MATKQIESSKQQLSEKINEMKRYLGGNYMILFCRYQISTHPAGQISRYNYMEKSLFIPARRDRFLPGICLQKPIESIEFVESTQKTIELKMFTKWWSSRKTFFLLFAYRLTSCKSQKYNKNNYDLLNVLLSEAATRGAL